MRRLLITAAFLLCLSAVAAFTQQKSDYQVATVVAVATHKSASGTTSEPATYDVSLKVGNIVYVVQAKPPNGVDTVKYATGRQVLVKVGPKALTYHDLLGEAYELPILSQHPTVESEQPNSK